MMLYGYKSFRKSLKQVHVTSKRATKAYEGPNSIRFGRFLDEKMMLDGCKTLTKTEKVNNSSTSVELRVIGVKMSVCPSVRHFFQISETALRIFLKLCMKLDIDNRKKLTRPDFPKVFWIIQ